MQTNRAFTLIELLISMSLSVIIIVAMMQLYQGIVRYLEYSRDLVNTNRTVCLLFNQLERDLSAAYIPFLAKEVKEEEKKAAGAENVQQQPEPAKPHDKTKEQEKEEQKEFEIRKTFFIVTTDERAEFSKLNGKRLEQSKVLSFITTNALQVYGEKCPRLVRVVYEVSLDKAKSSLDKSSYKITRKESVDLLNTYGKVDDAGPIEKRKSVRSYVVAENVRGIYIEFITKPEPKKGEEGSKSQPTKEESKEVHSFKWGDVKDRQAKVPRKVHVVFDMWNEKKTKSFRFQTLFYVTTYPTKDESKAGRNKPGEKQQGAQAQVQENQVAQQGQQQPIQQAEALL